MANSSFKKVVIAFLTVIIVVPVFVILKNKAFAFTKSSLFKSVVEYSVNKGDISSDVAFTVWGLFFTVIGGCVVVVIGAMIYGFILWGLELITGKKR